MKVNAILLKPLDGAAPGSPRSFDQADFEDLKRMGAVRAAGDDDAIEEPGNEDAQLLDRFRHPVDGPIILSEMKSAFEALKTENGQLRDDLTAARNDLAKAHDDRDQAIRDLEDARNAGNVLIGERDALQKEIGLLQATSATPPRGSKAKPDA